jgi:type IV pilus assembly protein PilY1
MKKYLLLCLLVFTFSSEGKSPPSGTGTADVPANIMIMLDNSGSMDWGLLDRPIDVAVDTSGNIYVLEYVKGQISVFNSSGALQRICGDNTKGYKLNYPRQLTVYNDSVFVADTGNKRIIRINKDTCVLTGWTAFNLGGAEPNTVAVRGNNIIYTSLSNGWFFVLENRSAYTIDSNNASSNIQYFNGTNFASSATGLHINGNKLLVSSEGGTHYREINTTYGTISGLWANQFPPYGYGFWSTSYPGANGYWGPTTGRDAVFDSSLNVYLSDSWNYRVQKYLASSSSNTTYSTKVGTPSHLVPFNTPSGMGVDSNDNIYVADFIANKVYKFNTNLTLVATFTGGGSGALAGSKSRMDVAKDVIKKIVSNSDLTTGANFGLMEWGYPYATSTGGLRIRVPITSNGAKTIYTDVTSVVADGSTYLDAALGLAREYFNNGSSRSAGNIFYSSPINRSASCQLNYLIVISDGEWENPSTVVSLADSLRLQNPSIKTFAVGFANGGSSTNYSNLAIAGGTEVPLYAENEDALLQNLTSAISQILSSRLTFSSPAISTEISNNEFVYQATFSYSSNKQWEGNLKKYKFQNSTIIGDLVWDAADKLNSKSTASRNIWTSGLNISNINNFVDTYSSELQAKFMSPSITNSSQASKLINFIRGVDTYDQDSDGNVSENRHKLNDIYHSQLTIVGPPSLASSWESIYDDSYYKIINNFNDSFVNSTKCGVVCVNRKEILLAGSNGGMLHAFDTSTGEELWGFVPPSLLNKLPKIISDTPNYTNSIYGVDGTPVVKDIYYNGSWKTIALVGLGRGGQSYFALDITNPLSPSHLFTIENDDIKQTVNFWDSSGIKTEYLYSFGSVSNSSKDYSKLGEAWSTPRIFRTRINNADRWVAAFGAGYNGGANSALGSAVFIMDLENGGNILKKIDINDTANGIANSIPSDLVAITANGTSKAAYYGAMIYALDLEGKLTKIDITSQGSLSSSYQSMKLFDAETTTVNGRYIYTGAEATIDASGKLWLYFGTGDILKIQDQTSGILNRIYGIKDKDFPSINLTSPSGTVANCKNTTLSSTTSCPGSNDLGWYINLEKNQKLSAQPTIKNTTVYFPIYEPSTGLNICSAGNAILKATNTTCGEGYFSVTIGQGVATKVSTIGSKIITGISGKADLANATGFTSKDNIIVGDQVGTVSESQVIVEAWREN